MVGWKNHGWQGGLFVAFWRPSTCFNVTCWVGAYWDHKLKATWVALKLQVKFIIIFSVKSVLELNALPQQKSLSSHDITWFYTAAGWWPQTQVKAFAKTLDQRRPGRPDCHGPSSKTHLIATPLNTCSSTWRSRKSTSQPVHCNISICLVLSNQKLNLKSLILTLL